MIFLDFRCVNLILNDAKGSKYERQIVINFFCIFIIIIIIFFCFSIEFTKLQQYQQLTLLEVRSLELTLGK